jgi:hypothetical protein
MLEWRGCGNLLCDRRDVRSRVDNEQRDDRFQALRDNDYPAKSFDTGHPAYDRFLAGAKEWPPDYRAPDPPDAQTRAAILREMPFVAPIEAEPAESLGRAMLINAYAVPKLGNGWFRHPLELRDKNADRWSPTNAVCG